MQEAKTVFFVGKPGCGKGTQAKLLSQHTGWPVFGSGALFRDIAKEDTPVGRKIKEEMEAGFLAPPWFAMYLYLKTLFSVAGDASVIFDGFNRKIQEAELIVDSLSWLNRSLSIVNIAISDGVAHNRLADRKSSSGRADDHFVPERLKEYEKFTKDAIEIFRDAGVLIEVDGERAPDVIAADIRAKLGL